LEAIDRLHGGEISISSSTFNAQSLHVRAL